MLHGSKREHAVLLGNHLRAVARLTSASDQLRVEPHKSKFFLITSTLIVVKGENIFSEHNQNAQSYGDILWIYIVYIIN